MKTNYFLNAKHVLHKNSFSLASNRTDKHLFSKIVHILETFEFRKWIIFSEHHNAVH